MKLRSEKTRARPVLTGPPDTSQGSKSRSSLSRRATASPVKKRTTDQSSLKGHRPTVTSARKDLAATSEALASAKADLKAAQGNYARAEQAFCVLQAEYHDKPSRSLKERVDDALGLYQSTKQAKTNAQRKVTRLETRVSQLSRAVETKRRSTRNMSTKDALKGVVDLDESDLSSLPDDNDDDDDDTALAKVLDSVVELNTSMPLRAEFLLPTKSLRDHPSNAQLNSQSSASGFSPNGKSYSQLRYTIFNFLSAVHPSGDDPALTSDKDGTTLGDTSISAQGGGVAVEEVMPAANAVTVSPGEVDPSTHTPTVVNLTSESSSILSSPKSGSLQADPNSSPATEVIIPPAGSVTVANVSNAAQGAPCSLPQAPVDRPGVDSSPLQLDTHSTSDSAVMLDVAMVDAERQQHHATPPSLPSDDSPMTDVVQEPSTPPQIAQPNSSQLADADSSPVSPKDPADLFSPTPSPIVEAQRSSKSTSANEIRKLALLTSKRASDSDDDEIEEFDLVRKPTKRPRKVVELPKSSPQRPRKPVVAPKWPPKRPKKTAKALPADVDSDQEWEDQDDELQVMAPKRLFKHKRVVLSEDEEEEKVAKTSRTVKPRNKANQAKPKSSSKKKTTRARNADSAEDSPPKTRKSRTFTRRRDLGPSKANVSFEDDDSDDNEIIQDSNSKMKGIRLWFNRARKGSGPKEITAPRKQLGLRSYVYEAAAHFPRIFTTSREIALAAMVSSKNNLICRFHSITEKSVNRGDLIDGDNDTLYGRPWPPLHRDHKLELLDAQAKAETKAKENGTFTDPHANDPYHWEVPGWHRVKSRDDNAADCGCSINDMLLEMYLWKTGSLTSAASDIVDDWRSDFLTPRQRALVCGQYRESTFLDIDDLYSMVSEKGRWIKRHPLHARRVQHERLSIWLNAAEKAYENKAIEQDIVVPPVVGIKQLVEEAHERMDVDNDS
ncbi:hypothetical protein VNI00_019313 [Paramarasmius palmivorus]|uniref:Uncharacterized protein n=1 Tax=Paramarasmius palmivorus TaxID=297713 RepID=A0AAW0API1_9AGAR